MGKMLLLSFENSEDDVISEILSILENKQMKICENRNIKKCLEFQGLTINAERRLAVKGNKEIEFTFTEFEILLLLAQNAGMVFSKEKIYNIVWKEPYFGDYNIVMSHIRNLREKIEDNPSKPIYIQTVWGVVYRFNNLRGSPISLNSHSRRTFLTHTGALVTLPDKKSSKAPTPINNFTPFNKE